MEKSYFEKKEEGSKQEEMEEAGTLDPFIKWKAIYF